MKVTIKLPDGTIERPTFGELFRNNKACPAPPPFWKIAITWIVWHTIWRNKELNIDVAELAKDQRNGQ